MAAGKVVGTIGTEDGGSHVLLVIVPVDTSEERSNAARHAVVIAGMTLDKLWFHIGKHCIRPSIENHGVEALLRHAGIECEACAPVAALERLSDEHIDIVLAQSGEDIRESVLQREARALIFALTDAVAVA